MPYPVQIRSNGKDLFTRHKTADVAVMYATMPKDLDITLLDLSFFGDDEHSNGSRSIPVMS